MITHREAEILISARQDSPLDPVVERELQAHLATCDDCRAFAVATERLTAGIKAMPSVPASPRMRREVMEKVKAGRNPLDRLFAGLPGGFQVGPALAAVATIVVIGLFAWLALDRLVFDDGGGENNQIAAVPTAESVERFVASPTQVPATETPVPTDAPAEPTEPPVEPTETAEPTEPPAEPTETAEPTEPPAEPTEPPVEPTETAEPTEPPAEPTEPPVEPTEPPVEPTATLAPTEDVTEEPADLTIGNDDPTEPAETETAAPTEEPAPESTIEPTQEQQIEATEEATEEVTAEPQPTEPVEPTSTPAIEPMDGTDPGDGVEDDTGSAATTGDEDLATSEPESGDAPPIELIDDGTEATQEATGVGGQQGTEEVIDPGTDEGSETVEQIDDGPEGESAESTPEDETDEVETPGAQSLVDVAEPYSGIAGDPSGQLGLTPDGRLEFMSVPDGASMTTSSGFQLQVADAQPGVVALCGDGFCEPSMETPEAEGWQGDIPLGVMGETSYFLRLYGDRSEVYAATSEGTQFVDANVIAELGPTSAPPAVYQSDSVLFAWLPTGEWLEISGGGAQVLPGGYANPTNVRFAPIANQGPLMGYFSDGTLVIAPVSAPDSALLTLPTDGIDFDIEPPGDRVAVIRGSDIVIYDIQGNELAVYQGGELQPSSILWLGGGIVFVDSATGNLYQIPETAT